MNKDVAESNKLVEKRTKPQLFCNGVHISTSNGCLENSDENENGSENENENGSENENENGRK